MYYNITAQSDAMPSSSARQALLSLMTFVVACPQCMTQYLGFHGAWHMRHLPLALHHTQFADYHMDYCQNSYILAKQQLTKHFTAM